MNGSRKTVRPARAGMHRAGATIGLAAALTAAAAVPAHAAAPSAAPAGTRVTAVAGSDGSLTLHVSGGAAALTARAVPSTSPAVTRVFVPSGGSTSCPSGYACAGVPYGSGAYVFKFYRYGSYSLSYWGGRGVLYNHQTGGAAARYDNSGGGQIGCVPAGVLRNGVNWDPVWRIRLTSAGC
ncbi:hypothetical protein [Actinomadura sediminis]|uniref:Peptidase inhibitor family I36 n=1 Tax=Actinomadura sediminis TaxID=1038904 RepID=A0ABW3EVZ3_9ACTN